MPKLRANRLLKFVKPRGYGLIVLYFYEGTGLRFG